MVLGTIGKDDVPQLTVVWFVYVNGLLKLTITKERVKYKNILCNPRVGCLIYDQKDPYRYVQIRGKVIDVAEDSEYRFGDSLCERYGREAAYRYNPKRKNEGRVIVSILPEHYSFKFAKQS